MPLTVCKNTAVRLSPSRTKQIQILLFWFHRSTVGDVENVHILCAGEPESDDRGNNISVKRLGTSLDRCIERYIKKRIIIIIIIKNLS